MKKIIFRLILLSSLVGGAYASYRFFQQMPQRQREIATARVRQGDVVVRSFARGELRAVRSVTLAAPNLFGTVQVTKLAALGAFAREKDLVVEFDDAEVRSRLEEKQIELDQVDEQYKQKEADLAIRNNQDDVELLRARYSVRRAELEVKRNELLSAIDAKKNLLTLEESRRRLKQLESDIQSRREQAQAELAVLRERRQKAVLELNREKMRLNQVKLLAPISGLVAVKQNMGGPIRMMGTQMPDIREGDQVQPGMPVADVLDLSELEVIAKVGELDRANLREGQEVLLRLDAVPDKVFHGKIKAMSGTASANVFSSDPQKKFDVVFDIDMKELLSGLGATPQQIQRVMETAEANRKKPVATSSSLAALMMAGGAAGGGMPVMMGGGAQGGMPGGGAPAMMTFGGQQGGQGQFGGQGGQGGQGGGQRMMGFGGGGGMGGGGAMANMSDEDRQKMREAFQKALGGRNMQDLSQEERQKVVEAARAAVGRSGGGPRSGGTQGGAPGARPEESSAQPGPGREQRAERGGGEGGEGRRRGGGGAGGPGGTGMPFGLMSGAGRFSEKDLENAKLPPPPEEDAQLEVLLRPGLLADVEIIVEKVPNAIYVPTQALFEKDGKTVAFVKANNAFQPRVVKPSKRSESLMVIAEGLKAGDIVALADPTDTGAKKGKKQDDKEGNGGGGSPMGGMPTGGGPR